MVISAKTNGMVIFAGNSLTIGASVNKGEFLMTISGKGLAEENIGLKMEEARNNFVKSEADFERKTKLSGEKLIPDKELQEAKAHYLNSKAVYENFRDNFRREGQMVVAPMTGYIRKFLVQNGEYADAGQPLLVISQDRNLVLTADVLQKYLPELRGIESVTLKPVPGGKIFSLEELGGRILSVGKSINPDNGMIPVTLQISNSGDFIPGGIVEIFFSCKSVQTVQTVQTVPIEALMEEQGLYFVFVQKTPELFERREVIPGISDGLRVVIPGGLEEGERVVTKGAVLVKLAKASGALDPHAGHVH
jgi:RND family efflux transporter MFP subunit